MSYFEFAGSTTKNIPGLLIEGKQIHGLPRRDIERITVPGRNGDVLIDHGSYRNFSVSYRCAVTNYDALPALHRLLTVGALIGHSSANADTTEGSATEPHRRWWRGYQLLRDGWANWERLAVHSSQISMDEIIANRVLRFNVSFDCKPQRYFNRAAVVSRTGAGALAIDRPVGAVSAVPRIEIFGSGTVNLNLDGQTIQLTGLTLPPQTSGEFRWPSVTIDSEVMVAFRTNAQGIRTNIDIQQWPQFWRERHNASVTGTVSRVNIWPRWWAI